MWPPGHRGRWCVLTLMHANDSEPVPGDRGACVGGCV